MRETGKKVTCIRCGKETDYFVIGCYGSINDGEPICPKCLDKHTDRIDGIDYNRKIAVPEHKAGQTGG